MGAWGILHPLLTAYQGPSWVPCREGKAHDLCRPQPPHYGVLTPNDPRSPCTALLQRSSDPKSQGEDGEMQDQLGRRRCPWAVLGTARLSQTWGSSTTGHQGSHRQADCMFLISTNAIPTAPSLLGIIHGDSVDASTPQAQVQHVVQSFLPDSPSSQAPVTVALGLSIRCPKSVDLMYPCLGLPVVDDNESLGHGRRFQALAGCSRVAVTPAYNRSRSPHPSLPTGCPGLAERAFISPQSLTPPQPASLHQGRQRRARLGSSWLELALFCRTVISRAKFPIPSQNTAMLGEALYSQTQTTHICFLTVGIAPTGTEQTGSLLSPLPCD